MHEAIRVLKRLIYCFFLVYGRLVSLSEINIFVRFYYKWHFY